MNIGPPDEDGEDTKMITDRIICAIHHALKQAKEKEENEEVDKKKGTHILPLPIRTITWSYITYITWSATMGIEKFIHHRLLPESKKKITWTR